MKPPVPMATYLGRLNRLSNRPSPPLRPGTHGPRLEGPMQLQAFACRAETSLGRIFPEPEHELRGVYQRDRDRIVHSIPFRRLEYKTQVFVNFEGDHFRTRLTHSLEVA